MVQCVAVFALGVSLLPLPSKCHTSSTDSVGLLTLCICCMWSPLLQFYGGAAQDFGPLRPLWESYGWSLFRLQNPPAESNLEYVKVQVSRSKSRHALPALLL